MAGKVEWVWIDCFTKMPLNTEIYFSLKKWGYKICIVSPELQAHGDDLLKYKRFLNENGFLVDAVCSKLYNREQWISN